jgi:ABC-2 type transport system ATP-binding protein
MGMATPATATDRALVARGLVKRYGRRAALDGFDFDVAAGEIVGLVGPNGAGKSTFLKSLVGLVRLDAGEAHVFGRDPQRDGIAVRGRIGYLPGDLGFYPSWPARRFVEFCLSRHPRSDLARAERIAARLELSLAPRIKTYSTGMRQKLGLVQALACGGDLLLLDEPTRGLDPTSQATFLELLLAARAEGASILLSSHQLGEIERICDRVEFVAAGRRLDPARVAATRAAFRRRVKVRLRDDEGGGAAAGVARLAALPGVLAVERQDDEFVIEIEDGALERVVARLFAMAPESLEYNRPTLDELYRRLYLDAPAREEGEPR